MHAKDPVHWQLWGENSLKLAQKLNRPILISSGYYACHWCHVMQEENYQNIEIAKLLNQHFVSVKIDRELNPEIDQVLIDFARQTTGQAGWPQHVLLTPEGYPFAAFIYLPNKDLNRLLNKTVKLWKTNSEQISRLAKSAVHSNQQPKQSITKTTFTPKLFKERLYHALNQQKDDLSGGLKATAKFPKAPILNSLISQQDLPEELEEWLITSLDLMQSEHLIDHIHGGFYRYTIDPEWQIPHFEKMAYNSALLAKTYLLAGKKFVRPDYLKTAADTLHYLQNHLYNPSLKLYQSSQSAIDQHNIEGGDYLWTKSSLQRALSKEAYQQAEIAWQLDQTAPYEQGWHPKQIDHTLWPEIQKKLQTKVSQVPKDTKSILSWNGLILEALALASSTLEKEQYQNRAKDLASQLSKWILQDNPPRTISQNGTLSGAANLEDYAYILKGLETYQETTKDRSYNQQIKQIKGLIKQRFYQNQNWQFDAAPLLPSMQNNQRLKDTPLPTPVSSIHCLVPNSIEVYYADMLKTPIDYASLLGTLACNDVK